MFVKLNAENFRMLCELFEGANKDLVKVDAPKETNAYNPMNFDISYFRPKPKMRIAYDGKQGLLYIPDDILIDKS